MKAWYLDENLNKIEFESDTPCCCSCIEDEWAGYDYNERACCCKHDKLR